MAVVLKTITSLSVGKATHPSPAVQRRRLANPQAVINKV
jgi:hypothetical protein